jgi:Helix-turn-helix domain
MPMDVHLDENALAKRWSMSARTLQRWRQQKKGPPFLKLGGRVLYPSLDIEAYERQHRHGADCQASPPGGSTEPQSERRERSQKPTVPR